MRCSLIFASPLVCDRLPQPPLPTDDSSSRSPGVKFSNTNTAQACIQAYLPQILALGVPEIPSLLSSCAALLAQAAAEGAAPEAALQPVPIRQSPSASFAISRSTFYGNTAGVSGGVAFVTGLGLPPSCLASAAAADAAACGVFWNAADRVGDIVATNITAMEVDAPSTLRSGEGLGANVTLRDGAVCWRSTSSPRAVMMGCSDVLLSWLLTDAACRLLAPSPPP